MAWCRTGHKPLPKPMMTKFYDTICYAQWTQVNSLRPGDLYASLNWVIIGSCNGLSPFRHQTITRTKDDLSSIGPLYPIYTGAAPFVSPLCDHKTDQVAVAQRKQKGCLGRSRVAQRTFRPRHGRHGRSEVLSMFETVAQRSPRRSVANRSLKGGRRKAHASPWSQNGCTGVSHWSL